MGALFVEWQKFFDVGAAEVGWVGILTALNGPFGCLIAGGLTSRYGTRPIVIIGGLVFAALMLAVTFSTELWHIYVLIFVQSFFTGLAFQPTVTVIGFYFQNWLAFANGVTYSGVGIGIIVIPLLVETLSSRYTWKGAMRILSAISLLVCLSGVLFRPSAKECYFLRQNKISRKNRKNTSDHEMNFARKCYHFVVSIPRFLGMDLLYEKPRFATVTASCCVMGYGYYASLVFFASKAVFEAGLSKFQGALLLSFIGIGSTISRATHGFLLDCNIVSAMPLYALACFINAATDFLNPFAFSFSSLTVLAVSFGLSSGLIFAVSIMCVRTVLNEDQVAKGFGVILMFNGIGTLIGLFVMGYLEKATGSYSIPFIVAGFALVLSGVLMACDYVYMVYFHESRNAKRRDETTNDQSDHVQEEVNEKLTTPTQPVNQIQMKMLESDMESENGTEREAVAV
ncbi:monocarboxylate transporter 13-like isoform X2 [Apostichopus japonicus]